MSDSENSSRTRSYSDSSRGSHNPFAHMPPNVSVEPSDDTSSSSTSSENTRVIELVDRNREMQALLCQYQRDARCLDWDLAHRDGELARALACISALNGCLSETNSMLSVTKEEQAKSRLHQASAVAVIRWLVQSLVIVCWITLAVLIAYLLNSQVKPYFSKC